MGMKRASNFATVGPRPVARVVFALWLVGFGLLGGTIWSVLAVAQARDALTQTQDHIERLNGQIGQLAKRAEDAPDADALADQARRVAFFNTLTGTRAPGLSHVLALLETTLPPEVWVSQLSYSVESGRLSFSVQTDLETALPLALRSLEGVEGLRNVILDRQVRLNQGGRQLLQYDVKAEAK